MSLIGFGWTSGGKVSGVETVSVNGGIRFSFWQESLCLTRVSEKKKKKKERDKRTERNKKKVIFFAGC